MMTDNERIEWLNKIADTTKNTIHSSCDVSLFIDDFIATVDLINRQKAEIERYKGVIKILEKDVKDAEGRTVKEFAHYLIDNGEEGKINTFDLPDYVCEFLSKPEKVEHDSLCETETYKTRKG